MDEVHVGKRIPAFWFISEEIKKWQTAQVNGHPRGFYINHAPCQAGPHL